MLTKILLLFLPLIPSVTSDDCMERREFLTTFDAFTNCLSTNITENYEEISTELKYHTRKAVTICFASNRHEKFVVNGRCAMNPSELNEKAWDRNGPLRDCKLCRTFASAIVSATLYTPPEEARCFLGEIVEAVLREGLNCILKKDPAFPGLPPPVIEKPSQAQIADLVADISDYIIIKSRVKQCSQNDSTAAITTEKCLEKPFPGYLDAYNKVVRDCEGLIATRCRKALDKAKKAVCGCVQDARTEVRRRFEGLTNSIKMAVETKMVHGKAIGKGSKIENCVDEIKSFMKTDTNDWYEVIDSATGKCLKSNPMRETVGIKPLLHVGCKKVLLDKSGYYMRMLSEAFDFVGFLIDAITSHSSLICNM